MIVQSWREILQRHSLDAMVWSALPHVFGRNYLKANEKMLERIADTIVRRNHTEALRAHLEAGDPLSAVIPKRETFVPTAFLCSMVRMTR